MKQTILFFTLSAAALLSACDKNDDNNGTDNHKLAGTVWEYSNEYGQRDEWTFYEKTGTWYSYYKGELEEMDEDVPYTYKDGIVRVWEDEDEDYYAIIDWENGTMEWHWGGDKITGKWYEIFICYLQEINKQK